MLDQTTEWVVIGQFGRVHGVQGFIRVHAFTEHLEDLLGYDAWYRQEKNAWVPVDRLEQKVTTAAILAKIKGFETRESAMLLTHAKIAVQQSQLPTLPHDEFYYFELIGMAVQNTRGVVLGKVVDVFPTGANDVLVIEGARRHLLPYLRGSVIKQISRDTRQILVDWDEDF